MRENGGVSLLGICLFRLLTNGDETTLSLAEVVAALNDSPTKVSTRIVLSSREKQLNLRVTNMGTASTIISNDALTIDIGVPPGSVNGLESLKGFSAYETLCKLSETASALPCSQRRANVIRIKANSWRPSDEADAAVSLREPLPKTYTAIVTTRVNDGRTEQESLALNLPNE